MLETIGQQLTAARIAEGFNIEDVAHKTRIHRDVLLRLEAEEFDQFPNPMFARSFLKIYGEFVGVDTEPTLAELEGQAQCGEQFLLGGISPDVRSQFGHLRSRIPVRPILASAAAVVALAIGGSYLVSHLYGGNVDQPTAETVDPETLAAPAPEEAPEPGKPDGAEVVGPPSETAELEPEPAAEEVVIIEPEPIDPDQIPKGLPVVRKAEVVEEDEQEEEGAEVEDGVEGESEETSTVSEEPYLVPGFAAREGFEEPGE